VELGKKGRSEKRRIGKKEKCADLKIGQYMKRAA